jgi:hypothetical protein
MGTGRTAPLQARSLWYQAVLIVASAASPALALAQASESVPTVTIHSEIEREKLKRAVNDFVAGAMVQSHYEESLERWTYEPICPLVAGLPKAQGEFVLARLSQIVRAAGARLAGEKCAPNFFVIMSANPEPGLKQTVKSAAQTFNYETGAHLKSFVETPRPVRVWYNVGVTSIDGSAMVSGILDTSSARARTGINGGLDPIVNKLPSIYGSRLNASLVTRDILSVIIVVDASKVRDLNFGQLSDYVGMIGLAHLDLDKELGDAPTILDLFRAPAESRPKEMTNWDKALLHALYSTQQKNKMQLSQMQTAAVNEILATSSH